MTCTNSNGFYQWPNQIPLSLTQWKTILSQLPTKEQPKLFSSSDHYGRSLVPLKKPDRSILPRNQVFNDGMVDSFLVSSTLSLTRQEVPKILPPPSSCSKRYVSSFKTLVNSTSNKHTQRLNYINDSVVIFKLSKEHTNSNSQSSSKHSNLSTRTSSTAGSSKQQQQQQLPPPPPPPQPPPAVIRLSPILKIEGQKQRIVHHDSPIIVSSSIDISPSSNSTNPMATSTSNQLQTNSSVFTYRSAAAGGNAVRQRAIAETTSNSLLISADRFKSNMQTTTTATLRPARQSLTTSTSLPSAYLSSQPPPPPQQQQPQQQQRNIKSRTQQDKSSNSREIYEYPDPFTNCPQEILNKLSQLTKLQLETIDWERKKRFIKKKPLTNGTVQGKDSP